MATRLLEKLDPDRLKLCSQSARAAAIRVKLPPEQEEELMREALRFARK